MFEVQSQQYPCCKYCVSAYLRSPPGLVFWRCGGELGLVSTGVARRRRASLRLIGGVRRPEPIVPKQGVGQHQHLAHDRREGHLRRLATVTEFTVLANEVRIVADRADRRHVTQPITHPVTPRATDPNRASYDGERRSASCRRRPGPRSSPPRGSNKESSRPLGDSTRSVAASDAWPEPFPGTGAVGSSTISPSSRRRMGMAGLLESLNEELPSMDGGWQAHRSSGSPMAAALLRVRLLATATLHTDSDHKSTTGTPSS